MLSLLKLLLALLAFTMVAPAEETSLGLGPVQIATIVYPGIGKLLELIGTTTPTPQTPPQPIDPVEVTNGDPIEIPLGLGPIQTVISLYPGHGKLLELIGTTTPTPQTPPRPIDPVEVPNGERLQEFVEEIIPENVVAIPELTDTEILIQQLSSGDFDFNGSQ